MSSFYYEEHKLTDEIIEFIKKFESDGKFDSSCHIMTHAIARGRLDVVKWLHQNRYEYEYVLTNICGTSSYRLLSMAKVFDQFDIVKYAYPYLNEKEKRELLTLVLYDERRYNLERLKKNKLEIHEWLKTQLTNENIKPYSWIWDLTIVKLVRAIINI